MKLGKQQAKVILHHIKEYNKWGVIDSLGIQ